MTYIKAGYGFGVGQDFSRAISDTPIELAPAEYAKAGHVIGYIAGDSTIATRLYAQATRTRACATRQHNRSLIDNAALQGRSVLILEHKANDFCVGDRIEMHPATTLWMRGDRYATVTKVGATRVTVRLDKSARDVPLHASTVLQIME